MVAAGSQIRFILFGLIQEILLAVTERRRS
jgi:hypothetical protein